MYPVSTSYKSKIKELTRVFKAQLQIQHSLGVLDLTDADIVGGSLAYTEASQAGEDFTIGGVVASDLSVEILNKPEYATYNFMGATVLVSIGLEVSPDTCEHVPLGVFNVDDVGKTRNAISLKALDNMIKFDKPYSMSNLIYPANLLQIFNDACTVCGVTPGTATFLNSNYVVQERPEGDLTFRDILSYVAELSGSFARCNRTGAVELAWYEPTGLTLAGANRFDFRPSDDLISIKGVMATVGDTTYLAGSDEYAVDLTHNPLLQSDHQTVLASIFAAIKDTSFYPFESSWQGNPAIQAGDTLTQIDRDGKQWPTIVTSSTYKYRGSSTLKAQGLPVSAKGFKGSTNKKITNIVRAAQKETEIKLTTLEQAQLNATELVANMLGGHALRRDDAFYIADNPNLDAATKVWKWGVGGFGYSSTGVGGPYTTAITADGSIVAMLVAANIVTADMVKTGILQSEDGSTVINLDDGSFNFKDAIKWEGDELFITGLTGLLEENKQYGAVVISALKGLQVLDNLNKERVRLGRFEALGEQTATFARNSTAYLSDGTEVAANVPRFETVDGEPGLLVEEGTENLIYDLFTDAGFLRSNNAAIWPIETEFANGVLRVRRNPDFDTYPDVLLSCYCPYLKTLEPGVYVMSCKVRPELDARLRMAPADANVLCKAGKWTTLSYTREVLIEESVRFYGLHGGGFGPNFNPWIEYKDPQWEKLPYPTSFHPTTRASDQLLVPTSGLSPTKGMWEQRVYVTDVAKRQSGYPTIFNIPQNNGDAGIWLYHDSANWVLETRDFIGASTSVNVSDSYTPNGHHTFHVSWNTSKAVLSIDGVERGVIDNPNLPSAFAEYATVGYSGTSNYLNAHHGAIRHSSEPRTDLSDWDTLPLDERTTYLMRMDGNLQPTEGGAYGLLVRDKYGQKTILDENGILQTWQEGRADNIESGKPLVLSVFLPTETRQVNKAILRFKRQKFRAYEKAAASGGGATSGSSSTSTTASGGSSSVTSASGGATTSSSSSISTTQSGGATTSGSSSRSTSLSSGTHRHVMFSPTYASPTARPLRELRAYGTGNYIRYLNIECNEADVIYTYGEHEGHSHGMDHTHSIPGHSHGMEHTHTIGSHTHKVDVPSHSHGMAHTHTVPDHTHPLEFGIYEGTTSSKVTVKINGVDRTSALGGGTGFDVDKDNLDITPYLQVGQWNVIELGSSTLGRIDSTVFIQALMGVI